MNPKRRSKGAPSEDPASIKRHKPSSNPSNNHAEASNLQILLPNDKCLLFTGRGTLTVHSGEILASGYIHSASKTPINLSAEPERPLTLRVIATETSIPLAGHGGATISFDNFYDYNGSLNGVTEYHIHGDVLGYRIHDTSAAKNRSTTNKSSKKEDGSTETAPVDDTYTFTLHLASETAVTTTTPLNAPPFDIPPPWHDAITDIISSIYNAPQNSQKPAIIAICGSKNTGKSLFSRYLVNMLLNTCASVGYLDTDCGQPEFTPPGMVSLHYLNHPVFGQPHAHQHTPKAAYFIGDASPAIEPDRYQESIENLYQKFSSTSIASKSKKRSSTKCIPLVINTHGWIKGLGLDVISDMLCTLPVTHFVNITSPNTRKNFSNEFWNALHDEKKADAFPSIFEVPGLQHVVVANDMQYTLNTINNTNTSNTSNNNSGVISAVEQRSLHWITFAAACCYSSNSHEKKNTETITTSTTSTSTATTISSKKHIGDMLAAAPPYCVRLADITLSIVHCTVPITEIYKIANGAIVGLCTSSTNVCTTTTSYIRRTADNSLHSKPLHPCIGLGIIRSIDLEKGVLYLLSPLSEAALQNVDVLEIGRLELPPLLLQTPYYISPYLALHSLTTTGTGSKVIKSRNNLLRAGQIND